MTPDMPAEQPGPREPPSYFDILKTIDQFTLTGTISELASFLQDIFTRTKSRFSIGFLGLYVFSAPTRVYIATNDTSDEPLTSLERFHRNGHLLPQAVTNLGNSRYYPVYCPREVLLGAIVVFGVTPRNGDALDILIESLIQAIGILHDKYVTSEMGELWDTFATDGSSPEAAFTHIIDKLCSAVSFFDPINIKELAVNQLLVCQEEAGALKIRASRPHEDRHINLIVRASGSVSGLVLTGNQQFLCINPNTQPYRELYLNYTSKQPFSRKQAAYVIPVKTELVIPIHYKRDVIGVLNLESEKENAFSPLQIDNLRAYIDRIGPLVQLLESQWRLLYEGPKVAHDATGQYLAAYAAQIRHDVLAPLDNLKEHIFQMSEALNNNEDTRTSVGRLTPKLKDEIRNIQEQRQRVEARVKAVIDRLGLFDETYMNVRALIDDTRVDLQEVHRASWKEISFIDIVNHVRNTHTIHAHGLVRAYLFQLLDNAVRSLQEKRDSLNDRERQSFKGRIRVQFSKEKHFNGVYYDEYGVIEISDNGMGVTDEQLAKLREFNLGTRFRSGTGKGESLVATHRYMKQLGGWLDIASQHGQFFRVRLAFR
jgi:signal transduction histidine kinase